IRLLARPVVASSAIRWIFSTLSLSPRSWGCPLHAYARRDPLLHRSCLLVVLGERAEAPPPDVGVRRRSPLHVGDGRSRPEVWPRISRRGVRDRLGPRLLHGPDGPLV